MSRHERTYARLARWALESSRSGPPDTSLVHLMARAAAASPDARCARIVSRLSSPSSSGIERLGPRIEPVEEEEDDGSETDSNPVPVPDPVPSRKRARDPNDNDEQEENHEAKRARAAAAELDKAVAEQAPFPWNELDNEVKSTYIIQPMIAAAAAGDFMAQQFIRACLLIDRAHQALVSKDVTLYWPQGGARQRFQISRPLMTLALSPYNTSVAFVCWVYKQATNDTSSLLTTLRTSPTVDATVRRSHQTRPYMDDSLQTWLYMCGNDPARLPMIQALEMAAGTVFHTNTYACVFMGALNGGNTFGISWAAARISRRGATILDWDDLQSPSMEGALIRFVNEAPNNDERNMILLFIQNPNVPLTHLRFLNRYHSPDGSPPSAETLGWLNAQKERLFGLTTRTVVTVDQIDIVLKVFDFVTYSSAASAQRPMGELVDTLFRRFDHTTAVRRALDMTVHDECLSALQYQVLHAEGDAVWDRICEWWDMYIDTFYVNDTLLDTFDGDALNELVLPLHDLWPIDHARGIRVLDEWVVSVLQALDPARLRAFIQHNDTLDELALFASGGFVQTVKFIANQLPDTPMHRAVFFVACRREASAALHVMRMAGVREGRTPTQWLAYDSYLVFQELVNVIGMAHEMPSVLAYLTDAEGWNV